MTIDAQQFMLSLIKSKNPQQMTMNLLQQQENNPIAQNLLQLAQKGDTKGIEQVAKNIAKERGLDFDKEFNNFKQMFGF